MHELRVGIAALIVAAGGCGGCGGSEQERALGPSAGLGDDDTDTGDSNAEAGSTALDASDDTTSAGTASSTDTDTDSAAQEPSSSDETSGTGAGLEDCGSDASLCSVWSFDLSSRAWSPYGYLPSFDPSAPSAEAQAAFDIEALQIAFVLTGDTYHVFDLRTATWTDAGARSELLPEVGDAELLRANAVPGYWAEMHGVEPGMVRVRLATKDTEFIYDYDRNEDSFTFDSSSGEFPRWDLEHANAVALADIDAAWADVGNGPGWVADDSSVACPGSAGAVGPYLGVVSGGNVFKKVSAPCVGFLAIEPFHEFVPFSASGGPASTSVHAAVYNESEGLWIFR